jgi:hypothetical protein
MIVLTIFLLLIFLLVLWVVFIPIEIKVDTDCQLYEIGQRGTLKVSIHPGQPQLVSMTILGFPMNIPVKATPATGARQSSKKRGRSIRKSPGSWMYLFKGIMKSFRCKRFACNVDLDDVVLGAQIFPLTTFVSGGCFHLNINFQKHYYLNTWILIYPNRILWTLIRFFLTKK